MTTYNPVSPEFLAEVEAVIGKENVFTDPDKLDMYKTDEEYDPRRFRVPEAVVRPGNAEEIAAIVKLCNKYMVPITVRSGGTSLADVPTTQTWPAAAASRNWTRPESRTSRISS